MKAPAIMRRYLSPLLGAALFGISFWALYHELHAYRFRDLAHSLQIMPMRSLVLSIALTIASYWIKTGYDYYSLRIVGQRLPYRRIAAVSFIGFVLSNNLGLSVIPGASVRYRLYSPLGITGQDITKIVFFFTASLWLGFFILGSLLFLLNPIAIPPQLHLPFDTVYPLGFLLLVPVLVFLGAAPF